MCLIASILLLGPRAGILLYWIGWPAAWGKAFDHFLVPLIGFILFPWTTLMYVITAPDGVDGWDYLLIVFAVALDLASLLAQGGAGRRQMSAPAGTPGAAAT